MLDSGKKIKICVTGASGFIGSNLTELLSADEEIEIVPFSGDLLLKEDIDQFFATHKNIDQIVHLVGLFFGDFDGLVKVNVVALSNLLEAAVANGVGKMVFISTGAVYGEPLGSRSKETDLLNPNTLYGLSKKYAEECVRYYANNFDLDYVMLRFPNVYGKGNNKGVIYSLISSIKEKGEVTVYGDGTQSRNFLHVSDACLAIKKSIHYKNSGIFNISNVNNVSINDLVEILQKKYDFKVKYLPANNNLKDLSLDVSKAKAELGFESRIEAINLEGLIIN